ncbi:TetR-like C-terminal domain-containing protein [Companilactobacillus musae]|uniref:TetR/AcrR family transcriptional regulator n=1 Tax=Companilactobacillus musae TaxID=1903258 RepID=UPI000E654E63|nr:TetR-like C-terminal domain-containing protein [Companilactobacillus musae]
MDIIDEKIQRALLDLMKEMPLSEISIMAIADKSSVDQTTVYGRYVNKHDILQTVEDRILKDLNPIPISLVSGNGPKGLFEGINKQRGDIGILLNENSDLRFKDNFISLLTAKGLQQIKEGLSGLDIRQKELFIQYLSSALKGLVKYWLNNPNISTAKLSIFFENLFKNGLESFTEK